MAGLWSAGFATVLLSGALTTSVPLAFAGLGEQISETAGVLNVGIEGMMLAGAYTGFAVAYASGVMWPGFVAGSLAGMAVAAIMAICCVWLAVNQVVVGLALTLGLQGLTALLHHVFYARTYPRLADAGQLAIAGLDRIPVLGAALFRQHWLAYVAIGVGLALAWGFRRLFLGLDLAVAGEKPEVLDAAGVSVAGVRTAAVLATGALSGLGGAYLSQVGAGTFVPFMTNGAGFIGIVLAMLARGRPLLVLAGAVLFGASLSLTTALQVAGIDIPTDVIQMLPFAVVMLALIVFGRDSALPAALGLPYRRGAR